MVFQMLLCGKCYENVYTWMRKNYPSFKALNNECKRWCIPEVRSELEDMELFIGVNTI
jgi:hypothetical protein